VVVGELPFAVSAAILFRSAILPTVVPRAERAGEFLLERSFDHRLDIHPQLLLDRIGVVAEL
jgi:hypothetical protein